jgi:hypothetical protein
MTMFYQGSGPFAGLERPSLPAGFDDRRTRDSEAETPAVYNPRTIDLVQAGDICDHPAPDPRPEIRYDFADLEGFAKAEGALAVGETCEL